MGGRLSAREVAQFHEQGYLVVEDVLTDEDIQVIRDGYAVRLGEVAERLVAAGRLTETFADLPFAERYIAILNEAPDFYQHLNISLPLENDFPADADMFTGSAVFHLLTNPRLLDVVESIIGSEIYSNPVQHIRIKPPVKDLPQAVSTYSNIGSTTWHQDQGALMDEADETQLLTVWVAITEATTENGCLIAIPRSHKKQELTLHCPGKNVSAENYIPTGLLAMADIVPLPVGRGGVVLLHQYTEHSALANQTDTIRWSFDLRYHPTGQPTGRPAFPGFVARSCQNPESALTDPEEWAGLWWAARERILNGQEAGPIFNEARWAAYRDAPICA